MNLGKLYLLPNLLDENLTHEAFFPANMGSIVASLDGLIAESEKAARKFLRRFVSHEHMNRIILKLLNEHTASNDVQSLLEPILAGQKWGLISDAGLPCVADPGSPLVALANAKGVLVEAIAGPSSIIMALQLSGFSGQKFTFHGYLAKDTNELESQLKEMEKQAQSGTQIWIEAPYRSAKMLETLKKILQPKTSLCVAANLTALNQKVLSQTVNLWQKTSFSLEKEPAIFLIYKTQ